MRDLGQTATVLRANGYEDAAARLEMLVDEAYELVGLFRSIVERSDDAREQLFDPDPSVNRDARTRLMHLAQAGRDAEWLVKVAGQGN